MIDSQSAELPWVFACPECNCSIELRSVGHGKWVVIQTLHKLVIPYGAYDSGAIVQFWRAIQLHARTHAADERSCAP